jgi:hypothetical protein
MKILGTHEQAKLKNSGQEEIIKIMSKINEMETKRIIEIINETKTWFIKKSIKGWQVVQVVRVPA